MLNRRHLFAASAIVAVASAAPFTVEAAAHPNHAWFITEARKIIAMTARVNAGADEAYADAWSDRLNAFIEKVEALPLTAEHAPIKALGIAVLHCDEPGEWEDDYAADQRLAGQMVRCLTA
ncbi:hypothetical protein D3C86_759210 [compost metagenome]